MALSSKKYLETSVFSLSVVVQEAENDILLVNQRTERYSPSPHPHPSFFLPSLQIQGNQLLQSDLNSSIEAHLETGPE